MSLVICFWIILMILLVKSSVLRMAGGLPPNLRGPWTFGGVIIAIIILAACLGVLYVALPAMGIAIPAWAMTIFWIVIIAFVAIAAIRLLLGM